MTDALIVVGAASTLLLTFLAFYAALWLLERYVPAYRRWLDRWMDPR